MTDDRTDATGEPHDAAGPHHHGRRRRLESAVGLAALTTPSIEGKPRHTHGGRYAPAAPSRGLGARASNAAVARRVRWIWNANPQRIGTGDPDLIRPGTRLRV